MPASLASSNSAHEIFGSARPTAAEVDLASLQARVDLGEIVRCAPLSIVQIDLGVAAGELLPRFHSRGDVETVSLCDQYVKMDRATPLPFDAAHPARPFMVAVVASTEELLAEPVEPCSEQCFCTLPGRWYQERQMTPPAPGIAVQPCAPRRRYLTHVGADCAVWQPHSDFHFTPGRIRSALGWAGRIMVQAGLEVKTSLQVLRRHPGRQPSPRRAAHGLCRPSLWCSSPQRYGRPRPGRAYVPRPSRRRSCTRSGL